MADKTYLEVPFSEKEKAKSKGARWDGTVSKWFVPAGKPVEPFEQWIPTPPDPEEGVQLSQLMDMVAVAVSQAVNGKVWCVAEIADISLNRQNAYLSLIEHNDAGDVRAKTMGLAFGGAFQLISDKFMAGTGSELSAGMKVRLQVSVRFDGRYGFSLMVHDVDPAFTVGDSARALQAIIKKLVDNDLIEKNKRLPLPADFTRVAVIAPEGAAGLGDFGKDVMPLMNTGLCTFVVYGSRFQGQGAAEELCRALREALNYHEVEPFDALVVIRGGGSSTDLAWLNHYDVAALLANMPMPVFTGIGHERDDTVLDMVSKARFGTPSKVSAFIVNTIFSAAMRADENVQKLYAASNEAIQRADALVKEKRANLTAFAESSVNAVSAKVVGLRANLLSGAKSQCRQIEDDVKLKVTQLMSVDPVKVLKRGFGVVRQSGKHIPKKANLKSGYPLTIEFEDGSVEVQYE